MQQWNATVASGMAGETGGGAGGTFPLRAPSIPFPGWDRGGPIHNEN